MLLISIGFNADPDPDPAFYLNADPDPGSQTNADPDLTLNQCSEYMTFWCGSGSRSCYFSHWPSRRQQKNNKKRFFCVLLVEGTFISFFKDKMSGSGRLKKMWIRWIHIRIRIQNIPLHSQKVLFSHEKYVYLLKKVQNLLERQKARFFCVNFSRIRIHSTVT